MAGLMPNTHACGLRHFEKSPGRMTSETLALRHNMEGLAKKFLSYT